MLTYHPTIIVQFSIINQKDNFLTQIASKNEESTHIVGIWKLVEAMLQQWNATLKARQHIISKVEPFLKPIDHSNW